jgi:hypothetical protein
VHFGNDDEPVSRMHHDALRDERAAGGDEELLVLRAFDRRGFDEGVVRGRERADREEGEGE